MAKVIIGGQALSLVLTLLITPVAYSLWDDLSARWRRLVSSRGGSAPPPGRNAAEGAGS
jgi:HAE1 family hydrophobic/amphiphilic exporter-1